MRSLFLAPSLALALAAGCAAGGDPDVDEGLAPDDTSVISGDAVIAVPLAEPHPVVLFLAMVAGPTGQPLPAPAIVNLTVIPAAVLAQGGDGVRTGPYTFGLVAPAVYVVQGIVDVDENFNALVPALARPTAADVPGGYVDLATGMLIPIPVGPNQVIGEVTVMFAPPPPSG